MERISKCRICGSTDLKTVIDLGEQHLSGVFPRIDTSDPPKAPLELLQCDDCGLVQLSVDIPPEQLYGEGYGYRTGLNRTMKQHVEQIAAQAEILVPLSKGDVVIDIGSNDGTLLKAYKNVDVNRVGFDAAHYKKYYDKGITFIPGFFREYSVKAKIITSIAMFYDLPDPNQFVKDIKKTLHEDGVWILEQSYLPAMLYKTAFDTICHEHIEYYTVKQILWLLDKYDLRLFGLEFNGTNGGSFRCYVCHKNSKRMILDLSEFNEEYDENGVYRGLDFDGFNKRIGEIGGKLVIFLVKEKAMGKTIHLYGASTKGNVLLQTCGIDYTLVSMAVDVNPDKNGCWTPGTHIPIYNKEILPPDIYLVLPWHFKDQFIKQEHDFLQKGGRLLFPLPVPVVVSKDGERPL